MISAARYWWGSPASKAIQVLMRAMIYNNRIGNDTNSFEPFKRTVMAEVSSTTFDEAYALTISTVGTVSLTTSLCSKHNLLTANAM